MDAAYFGAAAGGREVFSWDAVTAQATREDTVLMDLDLWDVAVAERGREAVASPASPPGARCQVPGCVARFNSKSKPYHRRYKICGAHLAAPQVLLAGAHVRFCQQCGRFQTLAEFDPGRKSCREKLRAHNARRKKEARARAAAAGAASTDVSADASADASGEASGGAPPAPGRAASASVLAAPHHASGASDGSSSRGGAAGASGGSLSSSCAPGGPPRAWPRAPADSLDLDAILDALAADPEVVAALGGAPLGGLPLDAAPLPLDAALSAELPDSVFDLVAPAAPAPRAPPAWAAPAPGPRWSGGAGLADALDMLRAGGAGAGWPAAHAHAHGAAPAWPAADPSVRLGAAADVELVRASVKIFGAAPDALAPGLRQGLEAMLAAPGAFLACAARPGCVQLCVEALLTREEAAAARKLGAAGLLERALAPGARVVPPGALAAPGGGAVLQLGGGDAAVALPGAPVRAVAVPAAGAAAPRVAGVLPLAMAPAAVAALVLAGAGVAGPHDLAFIRTEGRTPDCAVLAAGRAPAAAAAAAAAAPAGSHRAAALAAPEWLHLELPAAREGLHYAEVARGGLLSAPAPFLVLADAAAVAELRQLESDASCCPPGGAPAFVEGVGVVLAHLRAARAGAAGGPNGAPEAARRVAALARPLAATAAARGWSALLRLLLPALAPAPPPAAGAAGAAAAAAASARALARLPHLAVVSRSAAAVAALGAWGAGAGHAWALEGAGVSRVTPLHLAALVDDDGTLAAAATALFPGGLAAWHGARTADGATPAMLALFAGNRGVRAWLVAAEAAARAAAGGAPGAPAPRRRLEAPALAAAAAAAAAAGGAAAPAAAAAACAYDSARTEDGTDDACLASWTSALRTSAAAAAAKAAGLLGAPGAAGGPAAGAAAAPATGAEARTGEPAAPAGADAAGPPGAAAAAAGPAPRAAGEAAERGGAPARRGPGAWLAWRASSLFAAAGAAVAARLAR